MVILSGWVFVLFIIIYFFYDLRNDSKDQTKLLLEAHKRELEEKEECRRFHEKEKQQQFMQREAMRRQLRNGLSMDEIAEFYGISIKKVGRICGHNR